ncbi:unnamed protein product [Brassica oleracea var. botrytis]
MISISSATSFSSSSSSRLSAGVVLNLRLRSFGLTHVISDCSDAECFCCFLFVDLVVSQTVSL